MAILHRHSIKPHGSVGGQTPAEVTGMDRRGSDKSPTPFQIAVAAT